MEMTDAELKEILMEHMKWLENGDGKRANFSGADLSRADLSDTNLSWANFSGANLEWTNFRWTSLEHANFSGANLKWVNFKWAGLSGADLCGADLRGALLSGADLSFTNFIGAYNVPYIPMACPDTGAFIAWKKASGYIVKLLIPEDAKRSSATSRKCRANKAIVLAIENLDGTSSEISEIQSDYDLSFIYRIGKTVEVKDFCDNRFRECASGIHFFIDREEAVNFGRLT